MSDSSPSSIDDIEQQKTVSLKNVIIEEQKNDVSPKHHNVVSHVPKINPAPLGLYGFGMTTLVLNIHNAFKDKYQFSSVIYAMGLTAGGIMQIVAGLLEFTISNNSFAGTAFTAYGFFWLSLIFNSFIPWFFPLDCPTTVNDLMAWYFFIWGVFTTVNTIAVVKHDYVTIAVFGSLALLFYLLAIEHWIDEPAAALEKTTGWVGIICACTAIYSGSAQIINDEWKKNVVPRPGLK